MGMSINAMLIYGADYGELENLEDLDDLLDDGDLDYASPHYDSSRDYWTVGVGLPSVFDGEAEMVEAIRVAKAEFDRITGGMPGRLIVSPDVT